MTISAGVFAFAGIHSLGRHASSSYPPRHRVDSELQPSSVASTRSSEGWHREKPRASTDHHNTTLPLTNEYELSTPIPSTCRMPTTLPLPISVRTPPCNDDYLRYPQYRNAQFEKHTATIAIVVPPAEPASHDGFETAERHPRMLKPRINPRPDSLNLAFLLKNALEPDAKASATLGCC